MGYENLAYGMAFSLRVKQLMSSSEAVLVNVSITTVNACSGKCFIFRLAGVVLRPPQPVSGAGVINPHRIDRKKALALQFSDSAVRGS